MATKTRPTKEMLDGIEDWLNLDFETRELRCPFDYVLKDGVFCTEHFTKCERVTFFDNASCEVECPCGLYSIKYVTKRAKHFVKLYKEVTK